MESANPSRILVPDPVPPNMQEIRISLEALALLKGVIDQVAADGTPTRWTFPGVQWIQLLV